MRPLQQTPNPRGPHRNEFPSQRHLRRAAAAQTKAIVRTANDHGAKMTVIAENYHKTRNALETATQPGSGLIGSMAHSQSSSAAQPKAAPEQVLANVAVPALPPMLPAAPEGETESDTMDIFGSPVATPCLPRLAQSWDLQGRDEQKPPKCTWRTWLMLGGRGSGKTRAGAEWVHQLAMSEGSQRPLRIALVAETLGDAREVMIDGVSGLCRIGGLHRPEFEASRRRLVWRNGTIAQIFSSEDPESLRGPQFDFAWCDELAKWKHAEGTFDMLQFGLRLGSHPRQLITTTPRPIPLIKKIIADAETVTVRMATRHNAGNLAPGFLKVLADRYGGTRLGRQEIDGELIEDRTDALWKRETLEALRLKQIVPLHRIVVAVDPPSAASAKDSCCGIIVAGLDGAGRAVVLADCSVDNATPAAWAQCVVRAFRRFDADRVVAEINQGGDMVAAMLKSVDVMLPLKTVRATRGKYLRAEPVAALYEQGRVLHASAMPELEDQMCDFGPDGLSSGGSPDRLDALVWALTALMLEGRGEPRVREI